MTQIFTLLSLAMIWVWFYWFYRDYRIDKFRQSLFSIRDELFDLALSGIIAFEHPAYGMMRQTINGMIRFSHLLSLSGLIGFVFIVQRHKPTRTYRLALDEKLADLNPDTANAILTIRDRIHLLVVEQLILTSAILCFTVLSVGLWLFLQMAKNALLVRVTKFLEKSGTARIFELLDDSSLVRGSSGT